MDNGFKYEEQAPVCTEDRCCVSCIGNRSQGGLSHAAAFCIRVSAGPLQTCVA